MCLRDNPRGIPFQRLIWGRLSPSYAVAMGLFFFFFFFAVAAMATVHMGLKRDETSVEPSLVCLWPAGGAKKRTDLHLVFVRIYTQPQESRGPGTEGWCADY